MAVTESGRLLLMKNYLWDFDGMLFDSYPHITEAFCRMMKESGTEVDFDEAKALLEITFTECYDHYGATQEQRKRHHELEWDYELEPIVKPFENTYKTLEALHKKGCRHFLYTHRGRETSQYYLKKYGMYDFFDGFADSSMNFPLKPAPDAIEYLCREYNLDKSETVMIGDREIDVAAGKNAGVFGCLYTKNKDVITVADNIVSDIIEIVNLYDGGEK